MGEAFGTQAAFGDIVGASGAFEGGADLFKTGVGQWSFSIISLKKIFDSEAFQSWSKTALKLTSVLDDLIDTLTLSKLLDIITDLSKGLYATTKELETTFGLFGENRDMFTNALIDQSQESIKYGIGIRENTKAFKALATEFRDFEFAIPLAGVTAEIAKAFDLGIEGTAEIVGNLAKFGGKDQAEIREFFEDINKQSFDARISHELVASNMASAAKSMYRFRIDTDKGEAKFKKMAVYATKMGIDLSTMVEAMDKYRTISSAIEGSVTAALAGLNVPAMQLLATARGGDPTEMFGTVLGHLEKFTDPESGALTQVGMDLADILGPIVNMSRDELNRSLMLMRDQGKTSIEYSTSYQERLRQQQNVQERMENILIDVFDVLYPGINFMLKIVEAITKQTVLIKTLLGVTAVGWAMYKANTLLGKYRVAMAGKSLRGIPTGVGNFLRGTPATVKQHLINKRMATGAFSKFTPEVDESIGSDRATRMSEKTMERTAAKGVERSAGEGIGKVRKGKIKPPAVKGTVAPPPAAAAAKGLPRRADGTFGRGLSPKQMTAQAEQMKSKSMMMASQAKQMLAGAVAMLAFAASVYILALAFKKFETVDWEAAREGIYVVGIFAIAMAGIGALTTAAAGPLLAMAVVMGAFSLSVMGIAKAFNMFGEGAGKFIRPLQSLQDIELVKIGVGLVALSVGMTAMMGVGALLGTVVGSFLFTAAVTAAVVTIAALGETVGKQVGHFEKLSSALSLLADSLARIKAIGDIDLSINTKDLTERVQEIKNVNMNIDKESSDIRKFVQVHTTDITTLSYVMSKLAESTERLQSIESIDVSMYSKIVEFAESHTNDISTLSSVMMDLAESTERIQATQNVDMNVDRDRLAIDSLEKVSLALAGQTGAATVDKEMIQNHITIEMDGVKVARQIAKSQGVRGG